MIYYISDSQSFLIEYRSKKIYYITSNEISINIKCSPSKQRITNPTVLNALNKIYTRSKPRVHLGLKLNFMVKIMVLFS